MPLKYGGRSKRTFIVSTDGVVWHKDLGRSEFVTDFPADPAAEGWHKLNLQTSEGAVPSPRRPAEKG
jgi:hypothetical protein